MKKIQLKGESGIFLFDGERDTKIIHAFTEGGSHQEGDIELLRGFVSKGDTIVDIGAHVGTFAVPLSRLVKKVYAIEPMPGTFFLLKENIKANNAINIEPINCAVSDKQEHLFAEETQNRAGTRFFPDGKGAGASADRLDKIIPPGEKISLIKIDAEGMELSALRGAQSIIKRDKPVIFLEINTPALAAHGVSRMRLELFFRNSGYLFFRNVPPNRLGSDELKLARIWSLYQGYFYDCLAIPKEKAVFGYVPALPFLVSQIKKKIEYILNKILHF